MLCMCEESIQQRLRCFSSQSPFHAMNAIAPLGQAARI